MSGALCPMCGAIHAGLFAECESLKARVAELEDMLRTADRRIDLDKRDSEGAAERFEATKAAVLAEREACAKLVEEKLFDAGSEPARLIRARGGQ